MTTAISYHSSSGESRRCDDNCHSAKGPKCDCICGRRNHGGGFDNALENNRGWFSELVEEMDGPADLKEAWGKLVLHEPEEAPAPSLHARRIGARLRQKNMGGPSVTFHWPQGDPVLRVSGAKQLTKQVPQLGADLPEPLEWSRGSATDA